MESLRAENEAITKYQFNKEQIAVSLCLFISRSFSLFFFFLLCETEKNDMSLSVRSKLHCSSLGFISTMPRLVAGHLDMNGLWTS